MGMMRRFSSARTSTPPATTSARQPIETIRWVIAPLSKPYRERHVRAPERQLLGPETDPDRVRAAAHAPEATDVPVDSDRARQKARRAAAHIHTRHRRLRQHQTERAFAVR